MRRTLGVSQVFARFGTRQWAAAMLGAGLLSIGFSALFVSRIQSEFNLTSASLSNIRGLLDKQPFLPPQIIGTEDIADFTTALPKNLSQAIPLKIIEASALRAHVNFTRLNIERRSGEPGQLSALEISLTLTGPYPDTKRFLSEVMSRLPNATLERLHVQRSQASPDPETSLVLKLWSRPGKTDQQAPTQADH